MDRIPETWKPYFALAVGHPERDRDFLVERSPRTTIDDITCPLLVIQGQNDPRVVERESHDLVEDLRGQGKARRLPRLRGRGARRAQAAEPRSLLRHDRRVLLRAPGLRPLLGSPRPRGRPTRGDAVRGLTMLVLVLGLALVGAGCGGDDDEACRRLGGHDAHRDDRHGRDDDRRRRTTTTRTTTSSGLASEECQELVEASPSLERGVRGRGIGYRRASRTPLSSSTSSPQPRRTRSAPTSRCSRMRTRRTPTCSAASTSTRARRPTPRLSREIQQAIAAVDQAEVTAAPSGCRPGRPRTAEPESG